MLYKGVMERTPIGSLSIIAQDNHIVRLDMETSKQNEIDNYLTKHFGTCVITPGIDNELIRAMAQLA